MVGVAVKQITSSVEARGSTSYSLEADGQGQGRRASAIRRYLDKLVSIHCGPHYEVETHGTGMV